MMARVSLEGKDPYCSLNAKRERPSSWKVLIASVRFELVALLISMGAKNIAITIMIEAMITTLKAGMNRLGLRLSGSGSGAIGVSSSVIGKCGEGVKR